MSILKKIKSIFINDYPEKTEEKPNGVINEKNEYINKLIDSNTIIGAIAGDIIGSVYEFENIKSTQFELFCEESTFTDDTVLTIAIADCLINKKPFAETVKEYGKNYYGRGFGGRFIDWLDSKDIKPYNSWGNGSAMRVSAVGFAYNSLDKVNEIAKKTAEITHNHSEGIKGAQATASAIFMARTGKNKSEIKKYISENFQYNLDRTLDSIRPKYSFDVSCAGSVPEAIIAFLESSDYETAIRLAISIGGDSDTIACITGGISSAFYKKIPAQILERTIEVLPEDFLKIIIDFESRFS